jgi:Tol biopolymer transport system component
LVEPAEPNSYVLDPALSPSASQIAYVMQPPPKVVDGTYDAGSDIWVADRDGSNAHRIFQHEEPNQLVRYPRWLDDQTLYAIIQVIESSEGITQAAYTLQRIDLVSGQRRIVLEDVVAFDISPEGSRITYARLEPASGETLHAVDIDGEGNGVELVPLTEELAPFNSPQFSPDGERIAFAAADQNMPLPTGQRLVSSEPVSLTLDGLPQDIWLIDAAGSAPQLAAELKEDIPALTWGGDGEYIYVLGVNALYEINLGNGAVSRIGEGVFHGQLTWVPGA